MAEALRDVEEDQEVKKHDVPPGWTGTFKNTFGRFRRRWARVLFRLDRWWFHHGIVGEDAVTRPRGKVHFKEREQALRRAKSWLKGGRP